MKQRDMKQRDKDAPQKHVKSIGFPWLTVFAALFATGYLATLGETSTSVVFGVPLIWPSLEIKYLLLALMLVVLLDVRRYQRQRRQQQSDIRHLQSQVDELWRSKKQLQLKAHTYSGHADKLKLFISDKLLDYIEYDEKFLHFKSIAAEVRHNGVISFDKVQTALQGMAAALDHNATAPDSEDIHAALDAMRYLWDLLDLSTADNLALHIGNLLCECEEHYYQRMLNSDDAEPLPFEPVYSPIRAAWRSLCLVRQERLPTPRDDDDYLVDDNHWHIHLSPTGELLGNQNHLVLLLENLIRNAQFFSRKRGYHSPFASIAVTLDEDQGHARMRIYNRGPHIPEEDIPQLFQLGFSTRRAREHHGRGLGLYFVNEIVKGYEGRIRVQNIHNPAGRYTIRIELDNNEVITEQVDVILDDARPRCRIDNDRVADERSWTFRHAVRNVEITPSNPGASTLRLDDFDGKNKQSRFDPAHPTHPQWRLTCQPKRHAHQLLFEPMDITGVEFEIRLPTAQQRLDSTAFEPGEDIDEEVERLDERFRARVVE